jgi:ArsR family metal-binding transcriptional regulator/DNA-binding CsgD family transcriptional regulator
MFISGYSDFSLSKSGMISNFATCWGAYFKLDRDISQLFAYINAVVEGTKFYDNPEYVFFTLDDIQCTLYPREVIAAPFIDEDQALKFVRRLIDFINDIYAKKSSIKPNHKRFRPLSVLDVYKLLPQTNCKECGFPTCMAFATALSQGKSRSQQCPGFSRPITETAVYPIYDRDGNLTSTVAIEIDPTQKKTNAHKQDDSDIKTNLTEREIQVLGLIAKGATNPEMSEELAISPHTVKSHVVHILNKLAMNDRTQAAVWAARNKII